MGSLADFPAAPVLQAARLRLEPLAPKHAAEMAPLLDDPALHSFIGGRPLSVEELHEDFVRKARGRSADGSQRWSNWVVRHREGGRALGTVQATVVEGPDGLTADVAWVTVRAEQGQGYATEAARCMVDWLRQQGVVAVAASIHPEHAASASVARALGLRATDAVVDGEVRWTDAGRTSP